VKPGPAPWRCQRRQGGAGAQWRWHLHSGSPSGAEAHHHDADALRMRARLGGAADSPVFGAMLRRASGLNEKRTLAGTRNREL
jgi:hypothetical protein